MEQYPEMVNEKNFKYLKLTKEYVFNVLYVRLCEWHSLKVFTVNIFHIFL